MHNDLYQWLKNDTGIAGIFGSRIYHMAVPTDVSTYPCMTFQQITNTEVANDMEHPDGVKLRQSIYQFDIVAKGSADVINAADSFAAIFRYFRGTIGSTTVRHTELTNSTHLEERDGDKLRRRISMDFAITFDD